MALGHRVELDAALLGSWYLEYAEFLALVEDKGVGVVVDDDYAMAESEVYESLVGGAHGASACWHVGIVDP